jgi:hypothetical protein
MFNRVTRFGEFSPFGRLFSLCSCNKNTNVNHIWATCFRGKNDILMGWATLWAIFFKNASGHPDVREGQDWRLTFRLRMFFSMTTNDSAFLHSSEWARLSTVIGDGTTYWDQGCQVVPNILIWVNFWGTLLAHWTSHPPQEGEDPCSDPARV